MTTAQHVARRQAPPPPNPARAARIRDLRITRGLTQLQVAAAGSLTVATLARAEHAGLLTERTARRLAGVYGCTPEELLK